MYLGVQHFSASTEMFSSIANSDLIPEEPEHSAGISRRLKSQEVPDEGIDLSRDR
jgi:hypothetical protein